MCHDCVDRRIHRAELDAGKSSEEWAIIWVTDETGFGIETSWRSSTDAVAWTSEGPHVLMPLADVRRLGEKLLRMCDNAENEYREGW